MNQKVDDEPSTSSNPVLELELTEEKLPMTLSRQEVSPYKVHLRSLTTTLLSILQVKMCLLLHLVGNKAAQRTRGTDPTVWRV